MIKPKNITDFLGEELFKSNPNKKPSTYNQLEVTQTDICALRNYLQTHDNMQKQLEKDMRRNKNQFCYSQ